MSELIDNNRQRREVLKSIIRDIHLNKDPEDLKGRFKELLSQVGATEIAQLEQELIQEGLPEAEIKSLCDVHVSVFKEGLERQEKPEEQGGHPIHTFKKENRAIERVIKDLRALFHKIKTGTENPGELLQNWREWHSYLQEIEKHYSRKENILFAYLDKHGVSGPPAVMWAIHDDIRAQLKKIAKVIAAEHVNKETLLKLIEDTAEPAFKAIEDMIYKEENILFPMSMETLTEGEWAAVAEQSGEIGYCLIEPDNAWVPSVPPEPVAPGTNVHKAEDAVMSGVQQGLLPFETGVLTLEQINLIFNHLPVDITFVDQENTVRYFSYGKERIFPRTKAIIGRKVQNCHPPDSVHIVNRIVSDFKSGKRDSAAFWIHMDGKFVYIRYFAVRDNAGNYAGTIEVTQDIQPITQLQGEKRIYSEDVPE